MEKLEMEVVNMAPILSDLAISLRMDSPAGQLYLRPHEDGFRAGNENALGIMEAELPSVLSDLRVKFIALQDAEPIPALKEMRVAVPPRESGEQLWAYYQDELLLQMLRTVVKSARVIAFDDWTGLNGGSSLWEGLLEDVIMPSGNTELDLIFYLGDTKQKLSSEVEDGLEVIGNFARYGKVTLVLDQFEAIRLWMILNGVHQDDLLLGQDFMDLKRKYLSIFRTVPMKRLLIYSENDVMVFAEQEEFIMAHKKFTAGCGIDKNARLNFIEGLSAGLLSGHSAAQAITLGQIMLGAGTSERRPGKEEMLRFIKDWLTEIGNYASIYLYQ